MLVVMGGLLLLLSGCVNPVLKPTAYSGMPTIKSQHKIDVHLATGIVDGGVGTQFLSAGNGVIIPMQVGGSPEVRFNIQDQEVFRSSLVQQINQSQIAHARDGAQSADDTTVSLAIIFLQTYHQPKIHTYYLDVGLEIISANKSFAKMYQIDSSSDDQFLEWAFTDAAEGKAKAAQLLMDTIIPDIEEFVRSIGEPGNST
jgi:hypothetical protein